jgi:methionine synthase II (cobalamin-independent)
MASRIVETILPTTMVGSYPRPHWYKQQLLGRDVRVAFKEVQHEEVYHDAVATVIRDQEEAGLDMGVLDVRSNMIESPTVIADRIKKVVAAVSPDRVVLSTDCGMKPLARMVAKMKLGALAEGARMVRAEVAGV